MGEGTNPKAKKNSESAKDSEISQIYHPVRSVQYKGITCWKRKRKLNAPHADTMYATYGGFKIR